MVEVFETNVDNTENAMLIIKEITGTFSHYQVSFDLEDCDRIMRIQNDHGNVNAAAVVKIVNNYGYYAAVLDDEIPQLKTFTDHGRYFCMAYRNWFAGMRSNSIN